MGIKNLRKLIEHFAPRAIRTGRMKDYTGQVLAIDASLLIYQFVIAIRGKGSDLQTQEGKITSHLHAIFSRVKSCAERGIKPVFVFDGQQPSIKREALKQRKELREKAKERAEAEDITEVERTKLFQRSFVITHQIVRECQQLLKRLGICYVQAPGEADTQCAGLAMSIRCPVSAVVSADMDLIALGTPRTIIDFSARRDVVEIDHRVVLRELGITAEQFIDVCILLGTEYCPVIKEIEKDKSGKIKTKSINFKTIFNEYKKVLDMKRYVKNLDKINKTRIKNKEHPKYDIPETFMECWKDAKQYYLEPEIINPAVIDTEWKTPDREGILQFMCDINHFDRDIINRQLDDLIDIYHNKGSNSNKWMKVKKRGGSDGSNYYNNNFAISRSYSRKINRCKDKSTRSTSSHNRSGKRYHMPRHSHGPNRNTEVRS